MTDGEQGRGTDGKVHVPHPHTSATRLEILLLLAGLVVLAACVALIDPLRDALQAALRGDTSEVREHLQGLGAWSVVMVFLLAQVHVFIWYPAEILDAAAGFVFGFAPALAMLMVFWTISAVIAFWVGQKAARPVLYRLAGEERFRRVERLVERGGVGFLLIARLVPIIPFSLFSFVAGAVHVPLGRFVWTTAVGYIPLTAYFVYLGSRLEDFSASDPIVWIGAVGFVLAIVAVKLLSPKDDPKPDRRAA